MANPYFCYAFAFIVALVTYVLGWSELYPKLTLPLLLFLGGAILLFSLLGILLKTRHVTTFQKITIAQKYPVLITLLIYFFWCIEFSYAGGVPLVKILMKEPFDYRYFGVPTFHVFVVTFSSFYTIYLFHLYLSSKSKILLALYCINLFAAVLIYNRGMLLFNLSSTFSLYLIYKQTISLKQVTVAGVAVIILFFVFGVLGSLRVSHQAKNKQYSNHHFLMTGRASDTFKASIVPDEFFWSYIYISSPLANLQNNINTYSPKPFTGIHFLEWINNEILFDFISKRLNSYTHSVREPENTIPGPFNASTIYSRSFSYLGWLGMMLMTVCIISLPVLFYRIISPSSRFFLTGLAILNTIFLFMIFDNTIRFTGLSFQLIYPVGLHAILRFAPYVSKFF